MASNVYVSQAEQSVKVVVEVGKAVSGKNSDEAALAIILAATQEVKKVIDPTSAVGRILVANILEQAAWKLGNSHTAFHKVREAASKLDPKK